MTPHAKCAPKPAPPSTHLSYIYIASIEQWIRVERVSLGLVKL